MLHLSGASWTDPRTVWEHDFGVHLRPLITFISTANITQPDNDYDVIRPGAVVKGKYRLHVRPEPDNVNNNIFGIRFNVTGDYVCVTDIQPTGNLVGRLRRFVTENPGNEVVNIDGFLIYTRKYFQSKIAFA